MLCSNNISGCPVSRLDNRIGSCADYWCTRCSYISRPDMIHIFSTEKAEDLLILEEKQHREAVAIECLVHFRHNKNQSFVDLSLRMRYGSTTLHLRQKKIKNNWLDWENPAKSRQRDLISSQGHYLNGSV